MGIAKPPQPLADNDLAWRDEDVIAFELFIRGRLERDKGNLPGALALFNEALDLLKTTSARLAQNAQ